MTNNTNPSLDIMDPAIENETNEYKTRVIETLKSSIDSYLEFSTPQELLTVVAENL